MCENVAFSMRGQFWLSVSSLVCKTNPADGMKTKSRQCTMTFKADRKQARKAPAGVFLLSHTPCEPQKSSR